MHDRDINVAINIENVGLASLSCPTASYGGSNDGGDEGSGPTSDLGLANGETIVCAAVSEQQTSVRKVG